MSKNDNASVKSTPETKMHKDIYAHDHSELIKMLLLSVLLIVALIGLNFWLN